MPSHLPNNNNMPERAKLDLQALLNRDGPSSQDFIDMNLVSQAIIEADGDLQLVAERLLGNKNLQDKVLSFITADRNALDNFAAKTRAYAMVKTMSIFSALSHQVLLTMADLKPEEAIKAFVKISDAMERLTKAQQVNTNNTQVNIYEAIMGQVPPQVASALKEIITQPQQASQAHFQSEQQQIAMLEGRAFDADDAN